MPRSSAAATLALEPEPDILSLSLARVPPIALAAATPVAAAGAGHDSPLLLIAELDHVIAEMTYHGLSRATGLSRSHITGILKGRRNCTVAYAERLAVGLGVSTAELLAYSGAKRVGYLATLNGGRAGGKKAGKAPGKSRRKRAR